MRDGDIATVALNNPGKLNALTIAMWRELARVLRELSADDDLRCVVLRGAGDDAFAAGADIEEFIEQRATLEQAKLYHHELVGGVLNAVAECRHPTVALIKGACVGGGLEIACNCDLRISGESGRFGVPINRLGFAIAYDELAGLLALSGRAVAAEILLEGRVWNAPEAFAKGLLTRIVADVDVEREAYATARRIADGAPLVARWHKQFIRRLAVNAPTLSAAERDANFDYLQSDDYQTGIDSFFSKQKPQFKGR
ncbi:MAG: Enoyl-CoA hydratase [Betaproteobacteria bacterium]|nr:Enoyl-CoA hydratase [Betaproteobacteria bacterium]